MQGGHRFSRGSHVRASGSIRRRCINATSQHESRLAFFNGSSRRRFTASSTNKSSYGEWGRTTKQHIFLHQSCCSQKLSPLTSACRSGHGEWDRATGSFSGFYQNMCSRNGYGERRRTNDSHLFFTQQLRRPKGQPRERQQCKLLRRMGPGI